MLTWPVQLWSMTAKSLQHAESHMILLGRRTALERVAAFLMEMDARLGHTGSIELPMSHQTFIAAAHLLYRRVFRPRRRA
jgi:CRP-like cAMP-binding protein